MDNENEQAQEDVVEQEETTLDTEESSYEEETVTIPKSKLVKMQRKAKAYDANKDKPAPQISTSSDAKWKERMELKVDGYSDEESDFILKNGGKKALTNPFITKAIEGIREQKKAEAAMVESSPKSETEKRYTPEDFSKLPSEEQQKVLSSLK